MKDLIFEILKFLLIIQEVSNEERRKNGLKRLGKGYFTALRFNPYNPLSYILYLVIIFVGMLFYGIIGFWERIDHYNPFKWN